MACSDPAAQEKLRRAVIEGHIAAEDFNGVSYTLGNKFGASANLVI